MSVGLQAPDIGELEGRTTAVVRSLTPRRAKIGQLRSYKHAEHDIQGDRFARRGGKSEAPRTQHRKPNEVVVGATADSNLRRDQQRSSRGPSLGVAQSVS